MNKLTLAELDEIAERHSDCASKGCSGGRCHGCGGLEWPCEVSRLAEYARERAAREACEEATGPGWIRTLSDLYVSGTCDQPSDILADLRARGIKPPHLYQVGFPHNNCGGGCVKAGHSQFALLLDALPEVYAEWERNEQALRDQLGNVSILRDWSEEGRPLTLTEFRERIERGEKAPESLWAGCACLEPTDTTETER